MNETNGWRRARTIIGALSGLVALIVVLITVLGFTATNVLGLATQAQHDRDIRLIRGLFICIYRDTAPIECEAFQQIIRGDE